MVYNYDPYNVQINEFVKRARAAKIHAYIIGHLKKEMPAMMGKAKTQQRLIDNLPDEFAKVSLSLYTHSHSYVCRFLLSSSRPICRFRENIIYRRGISLTSSTSRRV